MLAILDKVFGSCPEYFPRKSEDSLNFLNRQIIHAMFLDLRSVITDLGQMKLDHMLEEFDSKKNIIPEVVFDDVDSMSDKSMK